MANGADKSVSELLAEIALLKEEIARLKAAGSMSKEDKLKLAILDRAPFTIWACDRQFRIVLWSGKCQETYGYDSAYAIGANYLDLFVDPLEQEESRSDCIKIIDDDMVPKNCLAYDRSRTGNRRTMLTNCFRILDEEAGTFLQAEVGLEISDLDLRKDEHRTLREVGAARVATTKRNLELTKRELSARIDSANTNKLDMIKRREQELNQWFDDIRRTRDDAQARELTKSHFEDLKKKRPSLAARCQQLRDQVDAATKIEELDALNQAIQVFASDDLFPTKPAVDS
jgi:PAS domain S-box-containing protein